MKKKFIFRCDGGPFQEIGLGHVSRSLAIAEALKKRAECEILFVMRESSGATDLVEKAGYPRVTFKTPEDENPTTLQAIKQFAPDVFVVDLLHVASDYLALIKKTGVVLITMDRESIEDGLEDVAIRPIRGNGQGLYDGYDYMVLPDLVQQTSPLRDASASPFNIFVSFGGYDAQDLTRRFIESLPPQDGMIYHVIVSLIYTDLPGLKKLAENRGDQVRIYQNPPNFRELLSQADIAVVAGGLNMFQAVASGVPSVVIAQYPHQLENAQAMAARGAVDVLGLGSSIDFSRAHQQVNDLRHDFDHRKVMAAQGRLLFDGLGTTRVSELIGIIDKLQWDSGFFGVNIAYLYPNRVRERVVEFAMRQCEAEQIQCLYYLCDCHDPESVQLVEKQGFHFVDIRMTFMRNVRAQERPTSLTTVVRPTLRPATPDDIPALAEIAGDSYVHSRYYFDFHFPKPLARKFYSDWITKSVRGGFDDIVFVADVNGKVGGYISCGRKSLNRGRIGLVGIARDSQGQGLGKHLVIRALEWFESQNYPLVEVVTQGRNIQAQRLYQSCGFRIERTELWYHKWR